MAPPAKAAPASAKKRKKRRECAGCSGRFRGQDIVELDDDSLVFFKGDELCRPCAHVHGEA